MRPVFITIVATFLTAMNFYIYRTAAVAYPQLQVFFATGILLLFLSLFIAIYLERRKHLALSLPFSWVGYTWLGISGFSVCLIALGDLMQLITNAYSNRTQFHATAIASLAMAIWSFIESQRVRVSKVAITSKKLKGIDRPLRIVQISDLHLGDSSRLSQIKKIVSRINELTPDVVVSTGDLFDGYLELMAPFVDVLREIDAPLGKFAVSGNHEVYAGLEEAMSLTELAGFTLLRDSHQAVTAQLTIAGVEDDAAPSIATEQDALDTISSAPFHLFLKHRPDFDKRSAGKFDLQLSGHTHGGQIFPFHFLTRLAYKARPGLSELAPEQQLYLSRGTGSWGPQMRLFAPPEITLIELSD